MKWMKRLAGKGVGVGGDRGTCSAGAACAGKAACNATAANQRRPVVLTAAGAEFDEGPSELDGHKVVEDRVDHTVQIEAGATEEEEPLVVVLLGWCVEPVEDDKHPIGCPKDTKEGYHYYQHLYYLESKLKGIKYMVMNVNGTGLYSFSVNK